MATRHSPTPEEVMAYLDGETPREERERMEAHLAACETCQEIAEDLRSVSRDAAAWEVDAPPSTLQAPAPKARSPFAAFWLVQHWRLAAIAASLGAVLLVPVMFRSAQSKAPTVAASYAETAPPPAARVAPRARPSTMPNTAALPPADARTFAAAAPDSAPAPIEAQPTRQPMLIRTATLRLVTRDFASARPAIERVVSELGGFIDEMTAVGTEGTSRTLRGTLRVPGARLDEALTRLRPLGEVVEDTQGAEDVTDQIVDLDARLTNARATERRLADILRQRTGRLSDVLDVEREIARVRLDIERLDGERTNLSRRVTYAALRIEITEERKARLEGPLPIATRIRIAFAEGLQGALESVVSMLLIALRDGPTLMFWMVVAALAVIGLRRMGVFRDSRTPKASE